MIKLIHGDCLEEMKKIPDKSVDLVLTDPPYGIGYDKMQDKIAQSGRTSNKGKWKHYGDNWDKKISTIYLDEIFRISCNQIIWGGQYYNLPSQRKWLIWNKIQRNYMTDGEMAWTSFEKGLHIFDMSRADAYINKTDGKFHPTQKPVQLFRWALKKFSFPKAKIFDPFMGSGTTGIACKELGLDFIGIEINKDYFEIAQKRINNTMESLF